MQRKDRLALVCVCLFVWMDAAEIIDIKIRWSLRKILWQFTEGKGKMRLLLNIEQNAQESDTTKAS